MTITKPVPEDKAREAYRKSSNRFEELLEAPSRKPHANLLRRQLIRRGRPMGAPTGLSKLQWRL